MASFSHYALRVPASLMEDVRTVADRDGVSMNAFIVQAVAEKVAALRARGAVRGMSEQEQMAFLYDRTTRERPLRMAQILAKAGTTKAVLPGDELPEGYFET